MTEEEMILITVQLALAFSTLELVVMLGEKLSADPPCRIG